jgi:hypothetical protein
LIARSAALWRRFVEGCSWEAAAPALKNPDRVADPSTLRRWFRSLDCSQPPFSFLRNVVRSISRWLQGGSILQHGPLRLGERTLFSFLQQYWPLRL